MTADWFAGDWGKTQLRLWAMGPGGVIATRTVEKGTEALAGPGDYERVLLDLADEFLAPDRVTEVILCGEIGAPEGWVEAPCRKLPCAPMDVGETVQPTVADPRLRVRILPGLSMERPAAVLRGKETRVAGFLAAHPGFDGVLCLPGSQTDWVHLSAGEVVSFISFMTGEIFELLSTRSLLRQALAGEGFDEPSFLGAVSDAISRPEKLASGLVPLRAEAVLNGLDGATARSRLSGLLIGAELAAARVYWLGREVAVVGAPESAERYAAALGAQGVPTTVHDGAEAALAGLVAAHEALG